MSLLSSRRRPWPYHMRLGSILGSPLDRVGLMLIPANNGLLIGRKQQMLDSVVPSQQEYGSAPVYRERTWAFRPTGGYGERVQSSWTDKRYYWGKNLQVAGGLFGKGPLCHHITPTTPYPPVAKFIDALNGTTLTQFILSGAYVLRRQDDTNGGQIVDFGPASQPAMDAARFKGGYAGATDNLYVAYATGGLNERTPAGTWTWCVTPAGFNPERVEVVGTQLWAADTINSVVRNVSADPKVATNWSGPIVVGNPSHKITAIRSTNNTLVIFKEAGGIFTLNADGTVNDLFPGLRDIPISPENGLRANAWLDSLWFRAGPSFYRLGMPGAELQAMGPGKILDNGSPVRGEPRTFCGWGGYQAYMTLWNPATATSYLLSYGSWEMEQSAEGASARFDDQFDGALAEWPNRKVTAAYATGMGGQDRLYIGFDDGTWTWIKLVQNALAADSGAEFTDQTTEIVLPLHHAMFQADNKHWLGFSVFGPVMRPGDEAFLHYRIMAAAGGTPTDPSGDWLPIGEFTTNGQRIDAPPNLAGNAISLKLSLTSTNTTTSPVLETLAIHERVVPSFKRDIAGQVDGRSVICRLDGAAYRPNPEQVHKYMMGAAAHPGSMAIELADETVSEIAFFGYQERMLPMQLGGGRGWAIDFEATQFKLLTIYGIIRRLRGTRIGELRGYTIASLRYL